MDIEWSSRLGAFIPTLDGKPLGTFMQLTYGAEDTGDDDAVEAEKTFNHDNKGQRKKDAKNRPTADTAAKLKGWASVPE